MYRPTIRCADVYKDYLDSLADVTGLDRNQLIRLALFSAPFSNLFVAQVKQHGKDVTLPSPAWETFNHGLWMEQNPTIEKEGEDVNAKHGRKEEIKIVHATVGGRTNDTRCEQPSEGRERKIYKGDGGGIRIRIG